MQEIKQQNGSPETWATKLKAYFARYEGAIIAYSGGVDSALLAYVAHLPIAFPQGISPCFKFCPNP
jgi:NH3-dependent NAD+ synthetase